MIDILQTGEVVVMIFATLVAGAISEGRLKAHSDRRRARGTLAGAKIRTMSLHRGHSDRRRARGAERARAVI